MLIFTFITTNNNKILYVIRFKTIYYFSGYPPASSSRYPSGSNSYYYSSTTRPQPLNVAGIGNNSAAPSPSAHSYRTNASVDHPPLQHHSSSTMPGLKIVQIFQ